VSREIERRSIAGALELRAKDGKKTLVGYAALYDSPSADLGGFTEVIRAGAFDRAIREDQEVLARAEHDTRLLLGRRSNGTCRVTADSKGLRYEVDVPDTQAGRDLMTLVERGDIRGSSFAFSIPNPEKDQRWSKTAAGGPLRELLDLDIHDVAPTADPAYPTTTVSARALEKAKEVSMTKPEEKRTKEERRGALMAKPVEERMMMKGSGYGCPCCMAGTCACSAEYSYYNNSACCASGACPCCTGDGPCTTATTCASEADRAAKKKAMEMPDEPTRAAEPEPVDLEMERLRMEHVGG